MQSYHVLLVVHCNYISILYHLLTW